MTELEKKFASILKPEWIKLDYDKLTEEQIDDVNKLEAHWLGLLGLEFTDFERVWFAMLLADFKTDEIMIGMELSVDKLRVLNEEIVQKIMLDVQKICEQRKDRKMKFQIRFYGVVE